jgi:large subunit ribosomal protein L29
MTFLKNKNFNSLTNEELESKILLISKELVELRLKKVTRQSFKSHEFKQKKCELSQLMTIKKFKKI